MQDPRGMVREDFSASKSQKRKVEYRALRRKYMMLEEENYTLDAQLGMAEKEAKTLEDEKFALLDQLVVLEGLVEPSQLQTQRRL
ncbi:unnamed protein product [Triticum turgidum subsp. durum]|uniref:Uncharacterized protein n=1 Tax=Triticum turgidum subsp. durum TaxID=4567 RepID=A0A9R0YLN4_TRITD|nr:unnamed protein product [Triticum turgidum subsp. durum]